MLGQDGEAGRRVFTPAEAQQGESHCHAAVHKASQTSQHLTFFVFFSEEEQKEDRGQEEEVGEAPGLPSTPGGGKGTSSKQVDGGARAWEGFFYNR